MPEMQEAPVAIASAQAAELSLLVDLEARWENLRKSPSRPAEAGPRMQELQGIQKAYEAFHAKLVAYNKRYTPAHVPELLLNTPRRLGQWCRTMRDLYLQVEHDPRSRCPVHLVEKAYRWADRVAGRMKEGPLRRSTPPDTVGEAIRNLEALNQWCDDLARILPTG
jgi:hypothetical protein